MPRLCETVRNLTEDPTKEAIPDLAQAMDTNSEDENAENKHNELNEKPKSAKPLRKTTPSDRGKIITINQPKITNFLLQNLIPQPPKPTDIYHHSKSNHRYVRSNTTDESTRSIFRDQ